MGADPALMECFARTLTRVDSDAPAEAFEGLIVIKPAPEDFAFARAVEVGWRLGMRHGDDFGHPRLPPGHALHRGCWYRITTRDFGSQRGTR